MIDKLAQLKLLLLAHFHCVLRFLALVFREMISFEGCLTGYTCSLAYYLALVTSESWNNYMYP